MILNKENRPTVTAEAKNRFEEETGLTVDSISMIGYCERMVKTADGRNCSIEFMVKATNGENYRMALVF